ncbi:MAG TPA: hypothetical protein VGA36_04480 [Nitriliruptorales bacterium]
MRTKLMGIALTAVLASSAFAGVASAHHKDGHDQNSHGMCTAYFSGSENGQGNKRDNGNAFGVFEEGIGDYDEDGDVDAFDVAAWCNDNTGGFGNPGAGNEPFFDPEQDDCEQVDEEGNPDEEARAECEALADQEGGSTPGESNGNNNPPGRS